MKSKDFRDHLDKLERQGKLLRVKKEVDPKHEIAAGIRKISDTNGPALLFENVKGCPGWRVAGGLYGTKELMALALETEPDDRKLTQRYLDCTDKRVKPKLVSTGPVKEIIIKGDDIDLTKLPIPTYCEWDAGPYFTAGVEIAKHPITGIQNTSIHRRMLLGKNKTSVLTSIPQHLSYLILAAEEQGQGLEIATAIGVHPALTIASQLKAPLGVDEIEIAGALRGEPFEVVKCETIDVQVPADAEIVIEGVTIPGERVSDGPFGEYPGNYASMDNYKTASGKGIAEVPKIKITAITMRKDAIFQAMLTGMPTTENHNLCRWALAAAVYRIVTRIVPYPEDIKEVDFSTSEGAHPHLAISIHKRAESTARNIIHTILAGGLMVGRIVVVDEDINIYDPGEIDWAIATRVKPDRDIIIIPSVAAPAGSLTTTPTDAYKWGIDATAPLMQESWRYKKAVPPGVDKVDYV